MRIGTTNVAAAGALLALPLFMNACSDGPTPSGSGSGAPTGAAQTTAPSASASVPASASASGPAEPACALDEAQYVDWDEWGKACGFAVPKGVSALPPRMPWEACGPSVGLPGCKKLKVRPGLALTGVRAGQRRQDVVEVAYVEECKSETSKYAQLVIHEADGPTLAAFASKGHEAGKCDVDIVSLHQGAYAARLSDEKGSGPGAFVGAPTQMSKPVVLAVQESGSAQRGAVVSDVRWVVFGAAGAKGARWGEAVEVVTGDSVNVEPSLDHHDLFWADVDAFVSVKGGKAEKLRESTGGDALSAAGTDGNHLVFTRKTSGNAAKPWLASSDHATEAGKLALRSVVPLAGTLDATPWTVGCGHAAHAVGPNQVLVVRLKDGVSWTASSKGCDGDGLCLEKPMVVTCSDVYYSAANKAGHDRTVVRITLAGLGKGKDPAAPPAPLGGR